MKKGMNKLRCGDCGNPYHQLYTKDDNDKSIFAECTKCHSVTEITFTQPKIELKWTENSNGILAHF